MDEQVFNVALLGYGLSAKVFQIPFIRLIPQFKLYAIVQRHPKPDDNAEKDNPGVKVYQTSESMVQDPAIDLVVIGTTSSTHYSLCKEALEAGKHGKMTFYKRPRHS
jgi:predicted dehydrogenase